MADELLDLPDPIPLRTNADWRWVIHLTQPEAGESQAEPLDLTGAKLTMHLRRQREGASVFMALTDANGRIVVLDAAQGKIAMNVDAAEIRAKLGPGRFWCDLHVRKNDLDLVPFERAVEVVEGITR